MTVNQPIMLTANDLKEIDPKGYFFNPVLPTDFVIHRFVDRTHRLYKGYKGNTALVTTYNFSLETIKNTHEWCQLIVSKNAVEEYVSSIPQFIVEDLELFMFRLAEWVRARYQRPVIGVTGSAGKSTTTKMLWHVLRGQKMLPMVNIGNHNDRHSVPYYLVNTIRNPEYTILELSGDTLLKEKRFGNLAELAKPDIGIVTSIGGAHLSKYKNSMNVAEIKSGLVEGMKPGGVLILNEDIAEPEKTIFKEKASAKDIQVLTYSMNEKDTNAWLISREWNGSEAIVHASMNNKTYTYQVPGGSDGTVQNSLAVLLALDYLKTPLTEDCLKRFASSRSLPRVLTHKQFLLCDGAKTTIIDDTHNSSVPSMMNAINYFKLLATSERYKGNKLLVLSKVADLGEESQKLHEQFIEPIAQAQADYIFLYGDLMKPLMKELRKRKLLVYHFQDLEEMIEEITELLNDDSLVIIKGSRSESDFETISKKLPDKLKMLGGKEC